MPVPRRRLPIRKEDTSDEVSNRAASGDISTPNQPWTRKQRRSGFLDASDKARIEWFKRNPDKLKGRFVNAGGLIGHVVGIGKVGKTNMTGLKIKDVHGKIDVADVGDLKSVDYDPEADAEAGVPMTEVESKEASARPAMRKAGYSGGDLREHLEILSDHIFLGGLTWEKVLRIADAVGFPTDTLDSIKGGQWYSAEWDGSRMTIRDMDSKAKASSAVENPDAVNSLSNRRATKKARLVTTDIKGTDFDARARIMVNKRVVKSKSFTGRFAKASARAWADAEVKKLG